MKRSMRTLALSLAVTLLAAGCDSTTTIGPENELEVTNATDSFQFQVSALETVTEVVTYTWQNTGPQATIDISQAITSGSAMLTLTDPDGTVVYQEDIRDDSDGTTIEGVAGSWTIRVELVDVTGTFNFRAQRTT
jgi:outer membrane biogenesis lipoprotein LolB